MVNPPNNPRASFRFAQADRETPEQWLDTAQTATDSWWPDYAQWLGERSGPEIDAPQSLGTGEYPPVAPAPGTYVHQN
jgi:polyhydroxyalkanoate synthase